MSFCCCLNSTKTNDPEKVYFESLDRVREETNIVNLLRTIQKLKAMMAATVMNDPIILQKAHDLYYENCLIGEADYGSINSS